MPHIVMAVAPNQAELREYELPPLGPKSVEVRSHLSGISHGTELALLSGTAPFASKRWHPQARLFVPEPPERFYPYPVGYENVGEVVQVGEDVKDLRPGERVWVAAPHSDVFRFEQGKATVFKLPTEVKDEEGIFVALSRVALYAVHDAQIKVGDVVAVFGAGAIGQLCLQLAKLQGAGLTAGVEVVSERLELAGQTGADLLLNPRECDVGLTLWEKTGGADVAIETSGNYQALHEAIRCVRQCGLVVALAYYQGEARGLFLGEEWHHNRITILSSMAVWDCPSRYYPLWDRERGLARIVELLRTKRLQVQDFTIRRFPLEEAQAAYTFVREHPEGALKVAFVP